MVGGAFSEHGHIVSFHRLSILVRPYFGPIRNQRASEASVHQKLKARIRNWSLETGAGVWKQCCGGEERAFMAQP